MGATDVFTQVPPHVDRPVGHMAPVPAVPAPRLPPPDVAPVPARPPEPPAPWLSVVAEQLIAISALLTKLNRRSASLASVPRRCVFTDQSCKRTSHRSSDFLQIDRR